MGRNNNSSRLREVQSCLLRWDGRFGRCISDLTINWKVDAKGCLKLRDGDGKRVQMKIHDAAWGSKWGDNIPARKLQSGRASQATWTHIPLLLCFLSALDDQIRSHHTVISWLQQENSFQCCHLCGHEEMLRGVPDEKLAKLHLQRDKLYLFLASDSQVWACLTSWTPIKSRKSCWRMKFLYGSWFNGSLMIRDKILFECIVDLHQTPITTPSRKTLRKKSSGTHSSRTVCLSPLENSLKWQSWLLSGDFDAFL